MKKTLPSSFLEENEGDTSKGFTRVTKVMINKVSGTYSVNQCCQGPCRVLRPYPTKSSPQLFMHKPGSCHKQRAAACKKEGALI